MFGENGDGTMTAGNSTPLSDGASVVLLASDEWAAGALLPVLAHLTHVETAAVDYVHGEEGLLMAPVYAVPKLLDKAGLSLQDFDFYEIHEAFAAQVLFTLKAWEDPRSAPSASAHEPLGSIDRDKLNVERLARWPSGTRSPPPAGGSSPRVAKLLAEKGSGRALISICAAGGQGVVAILERVSYGLLAHARAQHDLVERTHAFAEEVIRPVARAATTATRSSPGRCSRRPPRRASTTRSSTAT